MVFREAIKNSIFHEISNYCSANNIESFVVGGFVRDFFLKRPSKDIDILIIGDGINVAKQIAMHVAALKPEFVNIDEVPENRIDEEKDIIQKQSENEGKPAEVIEKIVEGKISSFYKDYVLNEQTFCNPEFYEGQVGTMIEELSGRLGEKIYIKKFSRIEVGA